MKKLLAIVMAGFLTFTLLLSGCGVNNSIGKVLSHDEAADRLNRLYDRMTVNTIAPRVDGSAVYDDEAVTILPDISAYPFIVNPTTSTFITIYASLENQGVGYKAWLTEAAENFNNSNVIIDGQYVSVGLRDIPSGLAADFISADKYKPDLYIAESELWEGVLTSNGVHLKQLTARLAGNVAGVAVHQNKSKAIEGLQDVINGILNGTLLIGYTNPNSDTAGFNFVLSVLKEFDDTNPFSETSLVKFRQFQDNIPYVAYDSTQLRNSVLSGVLDGFAVDYRTFISSSDLSGSYKFIPFGVRLDMPAYLVGDVSGVKEDIAERFVEFCKTSEQQAKATTKGFNSLDGHYAEYEANSAVIAHALETWKQEKNGTRDVTAVFIADVSGSMEGSPLLMLKAGLNRAASVIDSNANVGLVTFSDNVNINVPIGKFDATQRAYFASSVRSMSAGGGTAMFDAVIVAHKMLLDAKKNNPNTKLMLFVLTDGETNRGNTFSTVEDIIRGLQIPVYTIGYNANIDILKELSGINEATTMDAENDDIIQKLQNLFNSQM